MLLVHTTSSYSQLDPRNAVLISNKVVVLPGVILEDSSLPCHGVILDDMIATTPDCAKKAMHIAYSSDNYVDITVHGFSAHYDEIERIGSAYEITSEKTDLGILGLSRISPSYKVKTLLYNGAGSGDGRGKQFSNQIIPGVTAYYIDRGRDSDSTEQLISYNFHLKRIDSGSLGWELASARSGTTFHPLPPGTPVVKNNELVCLVGSRSERCNDLRAFSTESNGHIRRKRQRPITNGVKEDIENKCEAGGYMYMPPVGATAATGNTVAPSATEPVFESTVIHPVEFDAGNCMSDFATCEFSVIFHGFENYTTMYNCNGGCEDSGTSANVAELFNNAAECLFESTTDPITTPSGDSGGTAPMGALVAPLIALPALFINLW